MDGLLVFLALITTVIFVTTPVLLTTSIVHRYRRVEWVVGAHTATLRALVAYIERGQRPDATLYRHTPTSPLLGDWWRVLLRALRLTPLAPSVADAVAEYNVADELEDFLTVIREGEVESERYIRFKRKGLKMRQDIDRDVEFCRTYTEALPYLGILGTVLGFFFSPAVFGGGVGVATPPTITIGGLVLALSSTAAALTCIIAIKLFYENNIIPQVLNFEHALHALDDYAGRYGDITHTNAHEAPTG